MKVTNAPHGPHFDPGINNYVNLTATNGYRTAGRALLSGEATLRIHDQPKAASALILNEASEKLAVWGLAILLAHSLIQNLVAALSKLLTVAIAGQPTL